MPRFAMSAVMSDVHNAVSRPGQRGARRLFGMTARSARPLAPAAVRRSASAQMSPPLQLTPTLPAALANHHARAERRLSCAAGFLRSDGQAQQVAQDLRLVFGLDARQVGVLAPADAAAQRFAQVLRNWGLAPRPSADERRGTWALALGLAGVAALVALDLQLGALLAGVAAVMLAAALVAGLRPRPSRFHRVVQARLAKGNWAVLVRDVPSALQADVLTALRYNCLQWCADAPHRRRL